MQDKFPVAFTLIFVDDSNSFIDWLLDQWSLLNVTFLNAALIDWSNLELSIKGDW